MRVQHLLRCTEQTWDRMGTLLIRWIGMGMRCGCLGKEVCTIEEELNLLDGQDIEQARLDYS